MITLVEALNYRCLRHVRQPLQPFHVLVGPNASGKTTFLDVISFLGRLVSDGLDAAVEERTSNFYDLIWGREGNRFELAVEAKITADVPLAIDSDADRVRYEVAIEINSETQRAAIADEQLLLGDFEFSDHQNWNKNESIPGTIQVERNRRGWNQLVFKINAQEWHLSPEVRDIDDGMRTDVDYWIVHRPTGKRSVFSTIDDGHFPTLSWLGDFLSNQISHFEFDARVLRKSAPPGRGLAFLTSDGGNLPWVVDALKTKHKEAYNDWLAHLRTALPDLQGIRVIDRPEDRHRYLMLQYPNKLEVPSWMLSDGTLRLLALTVLAYIPGQKPICLIEEPENSIHPMNVETIMQSLQSVYDGQILVATHSPAVLAVTEPEKILVFSRDDASGTKVIAGNEHPGLKDWRGEISLGTLFAGGVLG